MMVLCLETFNLPVFPNILQGVLSLNYLGNLRNL